MIRMIEAIVAGIEIATFVLFIFGGAFVLKEIESTVLLVVALFFYVSIIGSVVYYVLMEE